MGKRSCCYAIFSPGKLRGVYDTWDECKARLVGSSSASYGGFKSKSEAFAALRQYTSLQAYKKATKLLAEETWRRAIEPGMSLAVDAACSGCPGPVEFRGVVLPDCKPVAFALGPFEKGTNNIGEFLAVVHGLKWLLRNSFVSAGWHLYSDSAVAIKWVTQPPHKCMTKLEEPGKELAGLLLRAENWLETQEARDVLAADVIRKWDTAMLGEIPADYARK